MENERKQEGCAIEDFYLPVDGNHADFGVRIYGPADYGELRRNFQNAQETADILHALHTGPDTYNMGLCREKPDQLFTHNRTLTTSNGLYVVHDDGLGFEAEPLSESSLQSRLTDSKSVDGVLFSADGLVRFVSKENYTPGRVVLGPEEVGFEGSIIAQYGPLGARQLGEIVSEWSPKRRSIEVYNNFPTETSREGISLLDFDRFGLGVKSNASFNSEGYSMRREKYS